MFSVLELSLQRYTLGCLKCWDIGTTCRLSLGLDMPCKQMRGQTSRSYKPGGCNSGNDDADETDLKTRPSGYEERGHIITWGKGRYWCHKQESEAWIQRPNIEELKDGRNRPQWPLGSCAPCVLSVSRWHLPLSIITRTTTFRGSDYPPLTCPDLLGLGEPWIQFTNIMIETRMKITTMAKVTAIVWSALTPKIPQTSDKRNENLFGRHRLQRSRGSRNALPRTTAEESTWVGRPPGFLSLISCSAP